MLVGTDVCVPVVFVWEETEVPGGTHLSDLVTILSHITYTCVCFINS